MFRQITHEIQLQDQTSRNQLFRKVGVAIATIHEKEISFSVITVITRDNIVIAVLKGWHDMFERSSITIHMLIAIDTGRALFDVQPLFDFPFIHGYARYFFSK